VSEQEPLGRLLAAKDRKSIDFEQTEMCVRARASRKAQASRYRARGNACPGNSDPRTPIVVGLWKMARGADVMWWSGILQIVLAFVIILYGIVCEIMLIWEIITICNKEHGQSANVLYRNDAVVGARRRHPASNTWAERTSSCLRQAHSEKRSRKCERCN
jgi:hypothetical protein